MIAKIKNKKAFMLGEFTMKIIIAVLCILLLIYLLYSIYSLFTTKTKVQQAEASLNSIIERINPVYMNGGATNVRITQPEDWVFFYDASGAPSSCRGEKYCLCLCPEQDLLKNQLEKCDKEGACKSSAYPLILEKSIKISGVTYVQMQKKENSISLS